MGSPARYEAGPAGSRPVLDPSHGGRRRSGHHEAPRGQPWWAAARSLRQGLRGQLTLELPSTLRGTCRLLRPLLIIVVKEGQYTAPDIKVGGLPRYTRFLPDRRDRPTN